MRISAKALVEDANTTPHRYGSLRKLGVPYRDPLRVSIKGSYKGSIKSLGLLIYENLGVPYIGVLIIRILLFRVLCEGPIFSETPIWFVAIVQASVSGVSDVESKRTRFRRLGSGFHGLETDGKDC